MPPIDMSDDRLRAVKTFPAKAWNLGMSPDDPNLVLVLAGNERGYLALCFQKGDAEELARELLEICSRNAEASH